MAGVLKEVIGVVLVAVGLYFGQPWLVKAGAVLLLNSAAELLTKGPGRPPVSPIDVAYSGTLEPRRIMYGTIKVSGMHILPPLTSGQNNDFFHFALALAGHPITSIGDVYFDTIRIASGDIGGIPGSLSDGVVTNHVTNNGYQGKAWIRRYDGTQTFPDFILNNTFAAWDSSHVGRGIPYVAVQLQFDTTIFATGVPQVTAVCSGKRVYDPRLDSTNGGSGSQRNLDSTTWTLSSNIALCLRDFLTSSLGLGESQSRIDDVLVAAAANKCDELLTVPIPVLTGLTTWTSGNNKVFGSQTVFTSVLLPGYFVRAPNGSMLSILTVDSDTQITLAASYSGASATAQVTQYNSSSATTTSQRRYTCNTVLDCTARAEDNIATLMNGMMGQCFYSNGKWRMYAGSFLAPAYALNEDDLVGGVSIQCATPRKDLYNAVRGNFLDPQQNYQPNEFPAILNSTFETQDGERIYTETNFACCTDRYEVQRNAMVLSRQSRNRHIITAQYGMSAFKVRPFETGTVSIAEVGWSNQSVRCTSWKFYPNGIVELTLQEAYSADWADPLITDYSITGINVAPPPQQYLPYPPTGLSFFAAGSMIQFQVTLPSQVVAGTVIELWEFTAASPFSSATKIAEGRSTSIMIPRRDTVSRFYWVRTRGPNGQVSPTFPSGNGLSANADTIKTAEVTDGAITTPKISDGAITPAKFSNGLQPIQIVSVLPTLPNAAYPLNSVVFLSTDSNLYVNSAGAWGVVGMAAGGAITTTQISDGAITTPKLAANAVTAAKIAANTITASQCIANMITAGSALIAQAAITSANIADLNVTNAKIANLTVGTSKIADGAISGVGLGRNNTGTYTDTNIISFNYTASGGAVLLQASAVGTGQTPNAAMEVRVNNQVFDFLNVPSGSFGVGVGFSYTPMIALLTLAPAIYTITLDCIGAVGLTEAPVLSLFELKK